MCGIAGYVGNSSREILEHMQRSIAHRGPDGSGTFIRDNVGFAHQRLAVIDTTESGHQPMLLPNEDVAIVFNGEIYNFPELRKKLIEKGCRFRGTSDTEVLLWLYATEGEQFLKKCQGMFALALYDFRKKKLILARDRMGEKPLYWAKHGETMYFASELSAFLETKVVPIVIDRAALRQYLRFDYVPTPHTIIQNVYKLEPAVYLVYENNEIRKIPFWNLPQAKQKLTEEEALGELDHKLEKAVQSQLVADVPLGIFLSGGLDSSVVAWYAARTRGSVDTFSIGFDDSSFDESLYASKVAAHLGTRHHEARFSVDEARALMPEIPAVFSEPVADASVLPTLLLSRFARSSVTVALGGDGGDELFAGYPTFRAEELFSILKRLPTSARELLRATAAKMPISHKNFSFSYNLNKLLSTDEPDPAIRHLEWLGNFSTEADLAIEGPALRTEASDSFEGVKNFTHEITGMNGLLWMYARTYLMDQVLVKVDRASMHYALETRAPLLDQQLVEYVFSLPYEMKYRGRVSKYLLKRLMQDRLPPGIATRPKKGFGVPMATWLAGPLRPLLQEMLSPEALSHGFFDPTTVQELMQEHFLRKRDRRKELWNLLTFQLWYQHWVL